MSVEHLRLKALRQGGFVDQQPLVNVLGILRLLRAGEGRPTLDLIANWTDRPVVGQSELLRIAAYVFDQVEAASTVIESSQLGDEAKMGIRRSLDGLRNAFALPHLSGPAVNQIGDIGGAIANFVILLSAMHIETDPQSAQEAEDLAKEVDALRDAFNDEGLDPLVRSTAKKHLEILATLLRHIPVFGLEAALVTYFELITKLRRADIHTSEKSKSKLNPLFDRINEWGKRLKAMDDTWNSGARWVSRAGKAGGELLTYLGGGQ